MSVQHPLDLTHSGLREVVEDAAGAEVDQEPAVTLEQLSDESAAAIGRVLPRLCRAVLAATGATAYNVLQNNGSAAHQFVMHVHFHIIPKYPDGSGLGVGWQPGKLADSSAKDLVAKIKAAVA